MKPFLSLALVVTALLVNLPPAFAQTPAAPETQPAPSPPAPTTPLAPPVLDFGDHSSSTLTSKAWDAFNAKNQPAAQGYAKKCIELYQAKAVEMQKAIAPAPLTVKEEIQKSWALNDVGTSYFVLGQSLAAEGKAKDAAAAFKFLVENLSLAQCWDTKGWFWKPADAARERAKALEFEALDEAK
ncbi:MAG: beta-glucanase precursor [Verrucomicrobiaceae bacterium]|nr:MAG: beta-glucanase precursor [Verrucomicrobiaceae bacterium]